MVAYPHRYREGPRIFKQVLDSSRYGRLISMDGLMDETVDGYLAPWMTKAVTLGGGCLFSASGHMLDIMLWICGDVQAAHMVGARGRVSMEGEDTAACIIKFRSGAIGTVRHTWSSPKPRIWYTMSAMCEKAYITLTTTPLGNATLEGPRCKWQTKVTAYGAGMTKFCLRTIRGWISNLRLSTSLNAWRPDGVLIRMRPLQARLCS